MTVMPTPEVPVLGFGAPYAEDDVAIAWRIWPAAEFGAEGNRRVAERATDLVRAMRESRSGLGGIEELLREYSLSTKEGLALMVLAEALLRVPDSATTDRLIEDKLGQGDFAHHEAHSDIFAVNVSAWALGVAARIVDIGENPDSVLAQMTKRIGAPAVRLATRKAMHVLGNHFVLGQSIEEAIDRATADNRYRYSFDMLGEGARTAEDAARHYDAYANAIEKIGPAEDSHELAARAGISVKLSALHPRYDALSRDRVMRELVPRLDALARSAMKHALNFTIDAEEADRLELSLNAIAAVMSDRAFAGWDGFGIAVQAYQKRAVAVIDWTGDLARALNRRFTVRLVKGAYWDTEIKRAQERGLDNYPVFTRKTMTDLNYVACGRRLLELRPRLFAQFATHNALTVASILEAAGKPDGFEFQRLHGMGEALYERLLETMPEAECRVYAPVGTHKHLLAYLVRRLLENGANSSFISEAADADVPIEKVIRPSTAILVGPEQAANVRIPLPVNMLMPLRQNSRGVEFGDNRAVENLAAEIRKASVQSLAAGPVVNGSRLGGIDRTIVSPIGENAGTWRVTDTAVGDVERAMTEAHAGFQQWTTTPAENRAAILERAADLIEERRGRFLHLLQIEGGKTIDDAVAEVREAADFCRYYASETRRTLAAPENLRGPTGEINQLVLRGRGVFAAISPWNFPLAIFLGQVTAALVAGNAVIAKPAEQTPVIAFEAVQLLHDAGVLAAALHFLPGDGKIGAAIVAHPLIAGVVFTGSTEVARSINRALAAKDGPIVPLIAETGGINAMIVDATALPEQVSDDVVTSAFRSAGQRCSALRLLFVQDDVADEMIQMIVGAVRELSIGDPRDFSVNVGPIIDAEAKGRLDAHIALMKHTARVHYAGAVLAVGTYVAPHLFELDNAALLREEVFGPILHVARYKEADLDKVIRQIGTSGYGLTLGIHSRIQEKIDRIVAALSVGNIYVNRNMIGAVVGVQPFGGVGLSGTGPKAGGPHYLSRFVTEQTVTDNIAAAGGNALLFTSDD
jgi:RHH-type transcriptional regulator, proline utilization regulon repressor / proline dehydrogenase / delta 1-pyrroline-5-carboxylate dehydrogenase